MCYVAPEGVVLGADSTASTSSPGRFHFFNHNQKLFEIGQGNSLGLLTWGLGGFNDISIRTLVARLADNLESKPVKTVKGVADRWATMLWQTYSKAFSAQIARANALLKKTPYDPDSSPPDPKMRTEDEEKELDSLSTRFFMGFCIAGYRLPGRKPEAYTIEVDPTCKGGPKVARVDSGMGFWGAPNFIYRLIAGIDQRLVQELLESGHWKSTPKELIELVRKHNLNVPGNLPIRDAIDFVYSSIHSTIKSLKFSRFNQVCGGPIEIAVITTDRRFRWVRHKPWHAAIIEGESHETAH
jgi:hypothetical protein